MLSPARLLMRGSRNFCPENFKFARFWEGDPLFIGGPLANFYGNLFNLNVVFKGMKVRTPCFHSDPHMLLL